MRETWRRLGARDALSGWRCIRSQSARREARCAGGRAGRVVCVERLFLVVVWLICSPQSARDIRRAFVGLGGRAGGLAAGFVSKT